MDTPLSKEENAIIMAFGKTSLFADFSYEMAHMILPLWILHLGGSAVTVSVMESLAEVARMGGAITTSRWGDSTKKQGQLIRIGYGLTAVATPAMGLVWAPGALIVLKSLSWFGKGLRGPARDTLVTMVIPKEWLSRAFSRIQTLDQTGAILGPVLATLLTGALPIQQLLLLTALPGALCFLSARSATQLVDQHTTALQKKECLTPRKLVFRRIFREIASTGGPGWIPLLLGGALLKMSIFPATLLMFRYNEDGGHSLLMGIGFILSSLVHVGAGLFLSFRPIQSAKRKDFLPGPVLLSAAIVLLLFPSGGTAFYLAGMSLWGAGELWTSVAIKTRVSSQVEKNSKTKGFAQLEIFTILGILAFQPAAAWGWEHGHSLMVLEVTLTFILAGTILLTQNISPDKKPLQGN